MNPRPTIAHLADLPAPLRLRDEPIPVSVRQCDDGRLLVDLESCALCGEGESVADALNDLRSTLLDWVRSVHGLGGRERLAGPLLKQWDALLELVDVSEVINAP